MKKYIVATVKSWNVENYHSCTPSLPGEWMLMTKPEELTYSHIKGIDPEYIFFLHWSWKVNKEITDAYDCVCFHMTDLPYGRGGSPLQNLILAGHDITKISALKMTDDIDAGPVYMKEDLSLKGNADEIFRRASGIVFMMIGSIVRENMEPVTQDGEVTHFSRRKPEQSMMPEDSDLNIFYDHVRMLDAEGYPNAFIDYAGYRIEFTDAYLGEGEIKATARIVKKDS